MVSVSVATAGSNQTACRFVENSPRYYTVETDLTILGVDNQYPASDALIRALQKELVLDECQLSVTQAESCDSGTPNLPCPDPFYQCDGGIIISPTLYDTILNGDCAVPGAAGSLMCQALSKDSSTVQAVNSGSCKAACFVTPTIQATASVIPSDCINSQVTIKVPTADDANKISSSLGTRATLDKLSSDMKASMSDKDNQINSGTGSYTGGTGNSTNGSSISGAGSEGGKGDDLFNNGKDPQPTSNATQLEKPTLQDMSIDLVHTVVNPVVGFGFFPRPPGPFLACSSCAYT